MTKQYFLRVSFGSSMYRWLPVDNSLFYEYYFNNLYCMKRSSHSRDSVSRVYYTFYKQRSNGLAKPNSYVRFMFLSMDTE